MLIISVMKISLILPIYNEQEILEEVLDKYISELKNACRQMDGEYEIVAINDGCTDHSVEILQKHAAEPYGTSQGTFYRWGSNMDVANSAKALLLYSRLAEKTPARKHVYESAALEHIHYILGRNPLSQCYVSGFGAVPMKNPHHRPCVAVGEAFPGMVSGGPNGQVPPRDEILYKNCAGQPPSKCYIDHIDSFSGNEVAIYWNSSVFFTTHVCDL